MPRERLKDPWLGWARKVVHGGDLPVEDEQAALPPAPVDEERQGATRAIAHMVAGQHLRRQGGHAKALAEFVAAESELKPLARREVPGACWALAWCRLWKAHADYTRGAFSEALLIYADLLPVMSALEENRGLAAVYRGLGNVSKYL